MIRVVLAVVLATALLGASLPAAERVEHDRNAEIATDELESVAASAERLASANDPVGPEDDPAAEVLEVAPPVPTVTEGGRIVVADDELAWTPRTGPDRTVEVGVPLRVEEPLWIVEPTRIRLAYVDTGRGDHTETTRSGDGSGSDGAGADGATRGAVVRVERVP